MGTLNPKPQGMEGKMISDSFPKRIAITCTGGIDSTVLAAYLDENIPSDVEINLISCYFGQASWGVTDRLLRKLLHRMKDHRNRTVYRYTCDFRFLEADKDHPLRKVGYKPDVASDKHSFDYNTQQKTYDYAYIDGRNAFMFLHMLSYCSKEKVPLLFTGHQYEIGEWENYDSYRHRTEDFGPMFIDRMNLLQEVGFRNRVRIEAPFIANRSSKKDICRLGMSLGIDLVADTYSCQFYPECGRCDSCMCRTRVFEELDLIKVTNGPNTSGKPCNA